MKTIFGVRDGKVVELKEDELVNEPKKTPFNIGGKSGFKWLKKSQEKTWISGDKIYKKKQDRKLS